MKYFVIFTLNYIFKFNNFIVRIFMYSVISLSIGKKKCLEINYNHKI